MSLDKIVGETLRETLLASWAGAQRRADVSRPVPINAATLAGAFLAQYGAGALSALKNAESYIRRAQAEEQQRHGRFLAKPANDKQFGGV